jgi:hypothetical protein
MERVEEIPSDLLPISVELFNKILSKTDLISIPQARKYDVIIDRPIWRTLGDYLAINDYKRVNALCHFPSMDAFMAAAQLECLFPYR